MYAVLAGRIPPHNSFRIVSIWLPLLLAWVSAGCTLFVLGAGAGGGAAGAAYVMGKLEAQLDAPVQQVHQATINGLKSLDLPIKEEKADKLTGRVLSETAAEKAITVDIESVSERRSELTIRVGTFGDEAQSRKILEAIKAKL